MTNTPPIKELTTMAASATGLALDQARMIVELWDVQKQAAQEVAAQEAIIEQGEADLEKLRVERHETIQAYIETGRQQRATISELRAEVFNLTQQRDALTTALAEANQKMADYEQLAAAAIVELEESSVAVEEQLNEQ